MTCQQSNKKKGNATPTNQRKKLAKGGLTD
jgi:hypothetical protein